LCLQLTSRLDASLQMDVLYTSQMVFRGGIHVVTRGIDGIDERHGKALYFFHLISLRLATIPELDV